MAYAPLEQYPIIGPERMRPGVGQTGSEYMRPGVGFSPVAIADGAWPWRTQYPVAPGRPAAPRMRCESMTAYPALGDLGFKFQPWKGIAKVGKKVGKVAFKVGKIAVPIAAGAVALRFGAPVLIRGAKAGFRLFGRRRQAVRQQAVQGGMPQVPPPGGGGADGASLAPPPTFVAETGGSNILERVARTFLQTPEGQKVLEQAQPYIAAAAGPAAEQTIGGTVLKYAPWLIGGGVLLFVLAGRGTKR